MEKKQSLHRSMTAAIVKRLYLLKLKAKYAGKALTKVCFSIKTLLFFFYTETQNGFQLACISRKTSTASPRGFNILSFITRLDECPLLLKTDTQSLPPSPTYTVSVESMQIGNAWLPEMTHHLLPNAEMNLPSKVNFCTRWLSLSAAETTA